VLALTSSGHGSSAFRGVPTGVTNNANPEIFVDVPGAVAYRYSINGSAYSEDRPISAPIELQASVRIDGRSFVAGSRELSEYINLRNTDESATTFVDTAEIVGAQAPLQFTYVVNPKRAAVLAENTLNLAGADLQGLSAEIVESTPSGPRYELTAFRVDGGHLHLRGNGTAPRQLLLSLPSTAATVSITPYANNDVTAISVNGAPGHVGAAMQLAVPPDGSS